MLNGQGTDKTQLIVAISALTEEHLAVNKTNPKFWAVIGFVVGFFLGLGGDGLSPGMALFGGVTQAAIWFGVSTFIIRRKKKKNN